MAPSAASGHAQPVPSCRLRWRNRAIPANAPSAASAESGASTRPAPPSRSCSGRGTTFRSLLPNLNGRSGPARLAAARLEAAPVVARRAERLDDDGSVGPGDHLVGDVAEDPPAPARPQLLPLAADDEDGAALEEDPDLLVLVAVLGDDGAGLELDERQRDPVADDGAAVDALPDTALVGCREIPERGHAPEASSASPGSARCDRRQRSGRRRGCRPGSPLDARAGAGSPAR